jgi:FG-GAP-like repeat
MTGLLEPGKMRCFCLTCLRAARLYLSGAVALSFLVKAASTDAQQVTRVPPFVGTHSETWERFGIIPIPSGTSIFGGIATISGDHMVTAHVFQLCSVIGRPSDGNILMDSDRPTGPLTISFSQPVSAFGAYWGSGFDPNPGFCYGNPPNILTFRDVAGNIIGTDSFTYRGEIPLLWRGYRFGTPVKTITRIAGDGVEGVAVDGLQATVATSRAVLGDFNNDGHPDYVLRNPSTRQTAIWYLNNNIYQNGALGPSITAGWALDGMADFNRDVHPDYALFNPTTDRTAIWYMSGPTRIASAYGPTLSAGWELIATGDFNGNGYPDYVLYNATSHQTAIWYLSNNVYVSGALGPTLPAGWSLVGTADFNRDGHRDFALFNLSNHQSALWYLSGSTRIGSAYGPNVPAGWALVATADFNSDGRPDYLLYNSATRQTGIWYLNNNVFVSAAFGPTVSVGWSLVGQ